MTGIKVNDFGPSDAKREYQAFWKEMAPVVGEAVFKSFEDASMRDPTMAEVKDRTEKAKKLVDELRNDFHWSKSRIRAQLANLIRKRLLGLKVDLEAESKRGTYEVENEVPEFRPVSQETRIELDAQFDDVKQDMAPEVPDRPTRETE